VVGLFAATGNRLSRQRLNSRAEKVFPISFPAIPLLKQKQYKNLCELVLSTLLDSILLGWKNTPKLAGTFSLSSTSFFNELLSSLPQGFTNFTKPPSFLPFPLPSSLPCLFVVTTENQNYQFFQF
jgi:hypothetical protein